MAGLRMGPWVHPDKAAMFDHLLFLCALGLRIIGPIFYHLSQRTV
jgi:hypothetical protein